MRAKHGSKKYQREVRSEQAELFRSLKVASDRRPS